MFKDKFGIELKQTQWKNNSKLTQSLDFGKQNFERCSRSTFALDSLYHRIGGNYKFAIIVFQPLFLLLIFKLFVRVEEISTLKYCTYWCCYVVMMRFCHWETIFISFDDLIPTGSQLCQQASGSFRLLNLLTENFDSWWNWVTLKLVTGCIYAKSMVLIAGVPSLSSSCVLPPYPPLLHHQAF